MKVVSLVETKPDADCIRLLTEALETAKAGRLSSVAVVMVDGDDVSFACSGNCVSLNYGLDMLKADLLNGED